MKSYRINLLPQKQLSYLNRIVYFGLHYLRYIIVLTQIVVIGVFFYRFKIDQEIIDLKENVQQKQEIFKITLPLVQEAQAVEKKTQYISTILNNQSNFYDNEQYIFTNIPQGIQVTSYDQQGNEIQVEGTAFESNIIQQLAIVLAQNKRFDVTIRSVDKTSSGFEFTLDIKTNG